MRSPSKLGLRLVLVSLLAFLGCAGGEDGLPRADSDVEPVAELSLGRPATLYLTNDSAVTGLAVKIRSTDGTEAYGLFRGPQKLAEVMTNGTWTFNADSLSVRVRVVADGERLVGSL